MVSIENRSNYQVTVKNRDDLTKLESAYSVRDRSVSRANQALLRGVSSPTLDTVEKLLKPMGMRAGAVLLKPPG